MVIFARSARAAFWVLFIFLCIPLPVFGGAAMNISDDSVRVAKKVTWPSEKVKGNTVEVLIGNFLVEVPAKIKRVSGVGEELLVFFEGGGGLHFDLVKASDLSTPERPDGITVNSRFSVSEAGQLPFEVTGKDEGPSEPGDRAVWEDALAFRKDIFGSSNRVFKAMRGNILVYYYESPAAPRGNYASVHDANQPDHFLHISGKNLSFEDFQRMIATIKTRG